VNKRAVKVQHGRRRRRKVIPFPNRHPDSPKTPVPYDEPPATVHVLHPRPSWANAKRAHALYLEADKLDEDPATYNAAERLYLQAVRLDPLLHLAYTNLGNLRWRVNDAEGALHWYERALAIAPKQPEAQYNSGYVYLETGRIKKAIECFKKAILFDPAFADAHFNLANALELSGQSGEQHWRAYLKIRPMGEFARHAKHRLLPKNTRKKLCEPSGPAKSNSP